MPKFSIKGRIKSFKHALNGIWEMFKNEPNSWIHALAVLVVSFLGFVYQVNSYEWIIIVLCFGIVLAAEAFNSSIEALSDKVELKKDPMIKKIKDLAAGAVLIVSISSAIVGLIIFVPKILNL